ncbi:hypothetical protein ACQKFK_12775 [Bacillus mycoides]|uniref:hypothetical protein n=1 Tax=Bacillus mycoides TaxID=1405 RepID=UPI000DEB227C
MKFVTGSIKFIPCFVNTFPAEITYLSLFVSRVLEILYFLPIGQVLPSAYDGSTLNRWGFFHLDMF